MTRTDEVSQSENSRRVKIEDMSIDGWKNSTNVVLYLKSRMRDGEEPSEPVMSEVILDDNLESFENLILRMYLYKLLQ